MGVSDADSQAGGPPSEDETGFGRGRQNHSGSRSSFFTAAD